MKFSTVLLLRPAVGSREEGKREEGKGEGGGLLSTGHLGEVMKESSEIAYTYAKVCLNILVNRNTHTAFSPSSCYHGYCSVSWHCAGTPSWGVATFTSTFQR